MDKTEPISSLFVFCFLEGPGVDVWTKHVTLLHEKGANPLNKMRRESHFILAFFACRKHLNKTLEYQKMFLFDFPKIKTQFII